MSVTLHQAKCPNCGGPLTGIQAQVVVCPFCQAELVKPADRSRQGIVPRPLPYFQRGPVVGFVTVKGTAYRVLGRIAQGEHCDVFLAQRHAPLTQQVLLKIARDPRGEALEREWQTVKTLREVASESHLPSLLPHPVRFGTARHEGRPERLAAVYRWQSGFVFTLGDARAEYPDGVDPRAVVWIWNRVLEQLWVLHQLGYAHRALKPEHLLIHPRDHGVMLCGWTACGKGRAKHDLKESGECVRFGLGKDAPKALVELTHRARSFSDAFELREELARVAEAAFGPPRFHQFVLTGQRP